MQDVTVADERYGLPERVLDALVAPLVRAGLPASRIDVDFILDRVRRSHGEDWGGEEFIDVWRALVHELQGRPITNLAHFAIHAITKKAVVNRIRLQAWLASHPEITKLPIERPVFIVGFPRTGTTVLQRLLTLHPSRRALAFWEMQDPVPCSDDPEEDRRIRLRKAETILWFAHRFAPEQSDIHEITATSAEEDWALTAHTFAVLNYDFQASLRGFGDHLMSSDMTWVYREFRTMLQVLLHQHPADGLVTKCPEHLWFLDALLEVFPDACIVWTHRDPFPTLASYCSLISLSQRTYYGRFSPPDLGPYYTDRFAAGVERAMAVRDRVGDDRFFDARFEDTVEDPKAVVRAICERFDLPYEDGAPGHMDAAIDQWLASDRKDKRGAHVYEAARYGLDRGAVHARFAPYIDRYGIALDPED